MRILILNGSPRQGNCFTAINAFLQGLSEEHEAEVLNTYDYSIAPCKECNQCGCLRGCVDNDDTNYVVDKIIASDLIVFVSPVFWWNISAQLKLVMDKAYSKGLLLKGKQGAVIIVGGNPTDNLQYDLIRKQFSCVAQFLGRDILFYKEYYAHDLGDLASNPMAIAELIDVGRSV